MRRLAFGDGDVVALVMIADRHQAIEAKRADLSGGVRRCDRPNERRCFDNMGRAPTGIGGQRHGMGGRHAARGVAAGSCQVDAHFQAARDVGFHDFCFEDQFVHVHEVLA